MGNRYTGQQIHDQIVQMNQAVKHAQNDLEKARNNFDAMMASTVAHGGPTEAQRDKAEVAIQKAKWELQSSTNRLDRFKKTRFEEEDFDDGY